MQLSPHVRPVLWIVAGLSTAAIACPSARGGADQTPTTAGNGGAEADASIPEPPLNPPSCADVGQAGSPLVNGLDAVLDVFHCTPAGGPELLLNVRLTNRSAEPLRLDTRSLPFPMLVFEVRDAQGDPVHGGPPPVPPADDPQRWRVDLAPNADYIFDAALDGVLATEPAPGAYEIRFVYEVATSDDGSWIGRVETGWIAFTVEAAAP